MLLESLAAVTSVVERRQTLPILANVFIRLKGSQLTLVGTDLEVEISVDTEALSGEDAESAIIDFSGESDKAKLRSGRSRFTLQALPPTDFPRLDAGSWEERFKMPQPALKSLFDRTGFSMAQQDVRYFLNGVLLELDQNTITAVAAK